MLDFTQSFVLGIPLSAIDQSYLPESFTNTKPKKITKKIFKSETSKSEKLKTKPKDNYKNTSIEDASKKDDDDIDWL